MKSPLARVMMRRLSRPCSHLCDPKTALWGILCLRPISATGCSQMRQLSLLHFGVQKLGLSNSDVLLSRNTHDRFQGQSIENARDQRASQRRSFKSVQMSLSPSPATGLVETRASSDEPIVFIDGEANSDPSPGTGKDYKPPSDRTLKLGKTIRILHKRLPTLLETPLPQEILSPQITLRLFPSTHPHLPVVSGRIAYTAALWTSPVAWGRVPVVGNVRLEILSERMTSSSSASLPCTAGEEKLIVRWKTSRSAAKTGSAGGSMTDMIRKMLSVLGGDGGRTPEQGKEGTDDFDGLFIFEFDEEGRVLQHTIEHVDQGNVWERTAKVISVTDWLLGKRWRREGIGQPVLAFEELAPRDQKRLGEED